MEFNGQHHIPVALPPGKSQMLGEPQRIKNVKIKKRE
jgi:hypothetical protein